MLVEFGQYLTICLCTAFLGMSLGVTRVDLNICAFESNVAHDRSIQCAYFQVG